MKALADALWFLAQRYECSSIEVNGLNPGQMPQLDVEWSTPPVETEGLYPWQIRELYVQGSRHE